jgi:16S rRNA (adenine1518-N6/adenine1519-N6)-dimethyltransferase
MLTDRRVAQRQAEYACLSEEDTVMEIGPGKGILTRVLAARAGKVVAIEKDEAFIPQLENLPKNVDVIIADALVYPLPRFNKVVANLPYVISSSITFRLLETDFELGVLMYQREFAERMCARVGDDQYSRLSVETFRRAECRILEEVPPSAFSPRPKVMSAIVELRPRPCPFPIKHPEAFSAVARAIFSHRRKSVRNALRSEERALGESLRTEEGRLGSEEGRQATDEGAPGLKERTLGEFMAGLDGSEPLLKRRAETLSPEEIAQLTDRLCSG